MNHPTEDQLLLLAYGELAEPQVNEIESHLGACAACAKQVSELERARVALDVTLPQRRRHPIVWATVALAAAAMLAVVITKPGPPREQTQRWTPTITWSATAGYVTGGKAMVDIDAQLTRLEQERSYGLPN
jgi:anti-sigma factor RsiW